MSGGPIAQIRETQRSLEAGRECARTRAGGPPPDTPWVSYISMDCSDWRFAGYHYGVTLQVQVVGQLLYVFWPVEQFRTGVRRTPAVAWSIDGDYAEVELLGEIVELRSFEAGAWEAVLVEDGLACGRSILRVTELTAVGKGQGGGSAVVEEEAAWGG
jgi:hypothetical protein